MAPTSQPIRRVIGFMTGTSIDGVDAALVEIRGLGLGMSAAIIDCASAPIGDERESLRAAANQNPIPTLHVAAAVRALSERHAAIARDLIAAHGPVDLVAVHGQTLAHKPPVSWQAVEPWTIALAARAPVVFDLRAADLARGGQGAPITPLADWVLFRSKEASRAVVNLGGFCNVTRLPRCARPEDVEGFDVCACNQLLDAIARRCWSTPFDEHGVHALAGEADRAAMSALLESLRRQRHERRSLGTGDESGAWIDEWSETLAPNDLAATAVAAVGRAIADSIAPADEVILAGGGVRNRALRHALEQSCGVIVRTTDEVGVPASHREAACMAVLGALCQDRIPITLPRVTGVAAPAPIAGSWVHFHA